MNGVIVVNKPSRCSSRDVVNKIGRILNTKSVGHTGTLDPLARGVLVLCVGKATKIADLITSEDKEYIAEVTLGILTDTLDLEGKLIDKKSSNISKSEIEKTLKQFKKTYQQEVPIYSAVKKNGKKLYEYAREGEIIDLPSREVTIKEIELIDDIFYKDDKTIFKFRCIVSKGTYIRSLIRDIATSLNTIGIMSDLLRTRQGVFSLDNSFEIEDIENNKYKIISIKECLSQFYQVNVDKELEVKILNGCLLDNIYSHDNVLFINSNDEVLSLYKLYEKDKTKLKPWKMFK